MKIDRQQMLDRLCAVEQLARAPRRRRLLHRPVRYLSATIYHRFLYPRFSQGWPRTASSFFGRSIQLVLPAATDIYLLGAKTHDSEIRLSKFMIRYLKAGATFVDVGAHYGYYSLLAAELLGPEGHILALEASARTFECLQANLRTTDQATALHLAAGNHNGTQLFYEFPVLYSEYNSAVVSPSQKARLAPQAIEVPCRRLDDLLTERHLQPDFIKIDVEGAEDQVIRGLAKWLPQASSPLIAMEYLAGPLSRAPHQAALSFLQSYGLQAFAIDSEGYLRPCPDVAAHLQALQLHSDNIVLAKKRPGSGR